MRQLVPPPAGARQPVPPPVGVRPPVPVEVRRWVIAPLAWLVLVLPAALLWAALDVREFVSPPIPASRVMVLPATVDPSYDGGPEVGLTYDNPVTGQQVVANTMVYEPPLRPAPGSVVDVAVDRDDPDSLALPGGKEPLWSGLAAYAWLPLPPVLVTLARLRTTRRTRRLIAQDAPSFSMLATLTSTGAGDGRRLHLYPLDARPASRPLCTIALVSAGGLLPDGAAFFAEVKGSPRAFGHVVARRGDDVLWPARRATAGRDEPRPTDRTYEDHEHMAGVSFALSQVRGAGRLRSAVPRPNL